ncbi:MAG: glycosyltransferase [bacterium]|nr:glycosyltransferase [bacterium]
MIKKRLGCVDHSFHKKTKSTYFLRNILAEHFEVIDVWDESWNGGDVLTAEFINSQNFEYVLFFQSHLPVNEFKKIKAKIIWVPMYDGVVGLGNFFWMEMSSLSIKIISFSKTLSDKLRYFGFDVFDVQYFFDFNKFEKIEKSDGIKIFFWQRTDFNFNDVKKIIGNQKINQFILKLDPDPRYKAVFPSQKDMEKYNVRIVQGFLSKEEYMQMLSESNLFISPRKFEGIGMSFIEAMTMGLAVAAIDNPTMNEYIKHGENGYLLKLNQLEEIDFSEFSKVGENARIYCENGYIKWTEDSNKISEFILSDFNDSVDLSLYKRSYVEIMQAIYFILKKIASILRQCKLKI